VTEPGPSGGPTDDGPERRSSAQVVAEVVAFLPDVARMFVRVVQDPRVPRTAKLQAAGLLALGLSPVDAIPVIGEATIVAMVALATRQLVEGAGEEILREHWSGSDRGFRTLMLVVDTGLRPRRMIARAFKAAYSRARES